MKHTTFLSNTLTALLLLFTITTFAQSSTAKTLVKSFNLQGNELVAINMEAPVKVQTWSNPLMRVQIQIELENGNSALLKSLVQAGRYNLRYKVEGDQYKVYAPAMDMDVKISGQPLKDHVSFVVFVPEGVAVTLPETAPEVADTEIEDMN